MEPEANNQQLVPATVGPNPSKTVTTEYTAGVNLGVFHATAKIENQNATPPVQQARNWLYKFKSMLAEASNKKAVGAVIRDIGASMEKTQFCEVLDNAPHTLNFYNDSVAREFETTRRNDVMKLVWESLLSSDAWITQWKQRGLTFAEVLLAAAWTEGVDSLEIGATMLHNIKDVIFGSFTQTSSLPSYYNPGVAEVLGGIPASEIPASIKYNEGGLWFGYILDDILSNRRAETFFEQALQQGLESELEVVVREFLVIDPVTVIHPFPRGFDMPARFEQTTKRTGKPFSNTLLSHLRAFTCMIRDQESTNDFSIAELQWMSELFDEGIINYELYQQGVVPYPSGFRSAVACLVFSAMRNILGQQAAKYNSTGTFSNPGQGEDRAMSLLKVALQETWPDSKLSSYAEILADIRSHGLSEWPYEKNPVVRNLKHGIFRDNNMKVVKWGPAYFVVPAKLLDDVPGAELFLAGVAMLAESVDEVVTTAWELSLATSELEKPTASPVEDESAAERAREYVNHITDDIVEVKITSRLMESLLNDLARSNKRGIVSASDDMNFYVVEYAGSTRKVHTNLTTGIPWLVTNGLERLRVRGVELGRLLIWRDILIDRLDLIQTIHLSKLRESTERYAEKNAWKLLMDVILVLCERGRKIVCQHGFQGCAIRVWAGNYLQEESSLKYRARRRFRRNAMNEKYLIVDTALHIEGSVIRHDDHGCMYIERTTKQGKLVRVKPSAKHIPHLGTISHLSEVSDDDYVRILATSNGRMMEKIEADGF